MDLSSDRGRYALRRETMGVSTAEDLDARRAAPEGDIGGV